MPWAGTGSPATSTATATLASRARRSRLVDVLVRRRAAPGPLRWSAKGSVTIDGVSLTLVDVEAERFSVALIPHTLAVTTLGRLAVGDTVNLETDLLAKYVEKCLRPGRLPAGPAALLSGR